jgi:ABC-type glycerol-3-phosphate transport system permease component
MIFFKILSIICLIVTAILGFFFIPYYNTMIRAIESGKEYKGFFSDVVFKHNDSGIYFYDSDVPPEDATDELKELYKIRKQVNRWFIVSLLLTLFSIVAPIFSQFFK